MLLKIKPELVTRFHAQAIECQLDLNIPIKEWDEESITIFSDLVYEKRFTMNILNNTFPDVLSVELLDEQGNNISDMFKKLLLNDLQTVPNKMIQDENAWESRVAEQINDCTADVGSYPSKDRHTGRSRSSDRKKLNYRSSRMESDQSEDGQTSRERNANYKKRDQNDNYSNRDRYKKSDDESSFYSKRDDAGDLKKKDFGKKGERLINRVDGMTGDRPCRGKESESVKIDSTESCNKETSPAKEYHKAREQSRFNRESGSEYNKENSEGRGAYEKRSSGKREGGQLWNKKDDHRSWNKKDDSYSTRENTDSKFSNGNGRFESNRNRSDGNSYKKPFSQRNSSNDGDGFKKYTPNTTPKLLEGFEKGSRIKVIDCEIGTKLKVCIAWFVSPCLFYCKLIDSNFAELMENIQDEYKKRKPLDTSLVSAGDFIVGRFQSDRIIYRACVQTNNFSDVVVQFVDYGNVGTCKRDEIWAISEEHCQLPSQAIRCSLHAIKPPGGLTQWDKTTMNSLDPYFCDDEYTVTMDGFVEDDSGLLWNVTMIDKNGESTTDKLVRDGFAEANIDENIITEDPIDVILLVDQTIVVHLPCVESTLKFFLHIEPEKANFIQEAISSYIENPEALVKLPIGEISEGIFCLVKNATDQWYRACVLNFNSEQNIVNIRYVDFGDEDAVVPDQVFVIPENILVYNGQAVECSLAGVNELLSPELEQWFKETVEEQDLIAYVERVVDYKLIVTLFSAQGNNIPIPTESEKTVPLISPMAVLRQQEIVIISNMVVENSELCLYIQKVSDQNNLTDMCEKLCEFYDSPKEEASSNEKETFVAGTICAAKSVQYETWYRAKVLSVDGTQATVLYLDYGNQEVLPVANLRLLYKSLYCHSEMCLKILTGIELIENCDVNQLFPITEAEVFTANLYRNSSGSWCASLKTLTKSFTDFCIELNIVQAKKYKKPKPYNSSEDGLSSGSTDVFICHYESPSLFYMQLSKNIPAISQLQTNLQKVVKEIAPIQSYYIDVFAAKYEFDNLWYRSSLQDNKPYAIDFGFPTSSYNIKKLPLSISCQLKYAIKCDLDVEPISDEVNEQFLELTKNNVTGKMELNRNTKIVSLNANGTDVVTSLLEKGLVKRKYHDVIVTQINSLNEFYVQRITDLDLLQEMIDEFLTCNNWEVITPNIGDLVSAKSKDDDLWYRARVTDINESQYVVEFVDFGNCSTCDDIRILPDKFVNIPFFAIKCSANSTEDSEQLTQRFNEINTDETFGIKVQFLNYCSPASVVVKINEQNLLDVLKAEQGVSENNATDRVPKNITFNTVIISHINSPRSFYVQDENTILQEIEDALISDLELLEKPMVNSLVAAQFPEDSVWYRAKITCILSPIQYTVYFIDYGNTCDTSEIRKLPSQLLSIPPMAKHCSLMLPPGLTDWSDNANHKFVNIACDGATTFEMMIIEDGDPSVVSLVDNGVCIIDDLMSPPVKTQGSKIIISRVYSLTNFWIQFSIPDLDEMIAELSNAEHFDTLSQVNVDMIVAALNPNDECFYRGKVLNILNDTYEVLFIDYGDTCQVVEVKSLPDDLKVLPPLAKLCSLDVSCGETEWPSNAAEKFIQLINDPNNIFHLNTIKEEECINHVVIDINEEDLNSKIISMCSTVNNKSEDDIVEINSVGHSCLGFGDAYVAEGEKKLSENTAKSEEDAINHDTTETKEVDAVNLTNTINESIEVESTECSNYDETIESHDTNEYTEILENTTKSEEDAINNDTTETKEIDAVNLTNTINKSIEVESTECSNYDETIESYDTNEYTEILENTTKSEEDAINHDTTETKEVDAVNFTNTINEVESTECSNYDETNESYDTNEYTEVLQNTTKSEEYEINHDTNETKEEEGVSNDTVNESIKVETAKYSNYEYSELYDKNEYAGILDETKMEDFVTVCFMKSPTSFYVQNFTSSINEIQDQLAGAEDFGSANGIINSLVAAKCDHDENWYRAKIIGFQSDLQASVLFIDHGNTSVVLLQDLKELPNHLKSIPPVAKHCSLQLSDKCKRKLGKANNEFKELVTLGNPLFKLVLLQQGDPCLVNLIDNDLNIQESIEKLLANCEDDSEEECINNFETYSHNKTNMINHEIFEEEICNSDKIQNSTACQISELQNNNNKCSDQSVERDNIDHNKNGSIGNCDINDKYTSCLEKDVVSLDNACSDAGISKKAIEVDSNDDKNYIIDDYDTNDKYSTCSESEIASLESINPQQMH